MAGLEALPGGHSDLIKRGKPVLSVVVAPARGVSYLAAEGVWAFNVVWREPAACDLWNTGAAHTVSGRVEMLED